MAEVVKKHEFHSGRPRTIYAWGEWFDGRTWKLEAGKDFQSSLVSFTMAAYQAAKRRGGRVQIDKASEPGFVFLRFTPKAA